MNLVWILFLLELNKKSHELNTISNIIARMIADSHNKEKGVTEGAGGTGIDNNQTNMEGLWTCNSTATTAVMNIANSTANVLTAPCFAFLDEPPVARLATSSFSSLFSAPDNNDNNRGVSVAFFGEDDNWTPSPPGTWYQSTIWNEFDVFHAQLVSSITVVPPPPPLPDTNEQSLLPPPLPPGTNEQSRPPPPGTNSLFIAARGVGANGPGIVDNTNNQFALGVGSINVTSGCTIDGSTTTIAAACKIALNTTTNTTPSENVEWIAKIGKGGQLYSLEVPPYGELLPPQNTDVSPWTDDTFVTTTYDSSNMDSDPALQQYGLDFLQNGYYVKPDMDPILQKPFYEPVMMERFDASNNSYSIMNLRFTSQPSVHRSDAMMYTKYKSLGGGVLEITYYLYNFGNFTQDGLTFPWGGIRTGVMPDHIVTDANGTYTNIKSTGTGGGRDVRLTGGWTGTAANGDDPKSLAFALVHGQDPHYQTAGYEYVNQAFEARVDDTDPVRQFTIMAVWSSCNVYPGEGFFFKIYMVTGELEAVAAKAFELSPLTDYGKIQFEEQTAPRLPLYINEVVGNQTILSITNTGCTSAPVAYSFAVPINSSYPLLLMREIDSGNYIMTTDPYCVASKSNFVNPLTPDNPLYQKYQNRVLYRPYDGQTEFIGMLGYVVPLNSEYISDRNSYDPLSTIVQKWNINFAPGELMRAFELLIGKAEEKVVVSPEVFSFMDFPADGQKRSLQFNESSFGLKAAMQILPYNETIQGFATLSGESEEEKIAYSKVLGPQWLDVLENGNLAGTPGKMDAGLNSFSVSAKTESGLSDLATVSIDVESFLDILIDSVSPGQPDWPLKNMSGPSSTAYTDASKQNATISVPTDIIAQGGGVEVLVNGRGQLNNDCVNESVFFDIAGVSRILIDLGSAQSVTAINSFSWHVSSRINQGHNIYFTDDDISPPASSSVRSGDLVSNGWNLLANIASSLPLVDTQIGIRVRPKWGISLMRARYIMFDIIAITCFYGEIDVYVDESGAAESEMLVRFREPLFNLTSGRQNVPYYATIQDFATVSGDAEAGNVIYSKTLGPSWLEISESGVITGTPSSTDVGSNVFSIRAESLSGSSNNAALAVEVESSCDIIVDSVSPGQLNWPLAKMLGPSSAAYSDSAKGKATISVTTDNASRGGAIELLLNGLGQSNNDSPSESVFFDADTPNRVLIDLGSVQPVSQLNSFSWHVNTRANQGHVLYFTESDIAPPSSSLVASDDLVSNGWTRLVVASSSLPPTKDTQIGISIRPKWDSVLMSARYVLLDILAFSCFYGEVDVYIEDGERKLSMSESESLKGVEEAHKLFDIFDLTDIQGPEPFENVEVSILGEDDSWVPSPPGTWFDSSMWNESDVFRVQMTSWKNGSCSKALKDVAEWTAKIGKGGQLYSFSMSDEGELLPSQASDVSPWTDDSFVTTIYNDANMDQDPSLKQFGMNSMQNGYYVKPNMDPILQKPFYEPCLADNFDKGTGSYSIVNLRFTSQPSVHRSDVMMYSKYRSLGRGVLETTYYFYNFNENYQDRLNFPRGGIRTSKMPDHIISHADGTFENLNSEDIGPYNVSSTGGWVGAATNGDDPSSLAFAVVHGTDPHFESSGYDYIKKQAKAHVSDTGKLRDFTSMATWLSSVVNSGEGFYFRTFIVAGSLQDVANKAFELSNAVDYGKVEISLDQATTLQLFAQTVDSQNQTILTSSSETGSFYVGRSYALPVTGSLPLLLLRETRSSIYILTTDPYCVCSKAKFMNPLPRNNAKFSNYENRVVYRPYDGQTEFVKLLGYVLKVDDQKLNSGMYQRLSSLLDKWNIYFAPGETYRAFDLMIENVVGKMSHAHYTLGMTDQDIALSEAKSVLTTRKISFAKNEESIVRFVKTPIVRKQGKLKKPYEDTIAGTAKVSGESTREVIKYTKILGPSWLSVLENGTMKGVPEYMDTGLNTFSVRALCDGIGSDVASLNIYVESVVEIEVEQKSPGSSNWSLLKLPGPSTSAFSDISKGMVTISIPTDNPPQSGLPENLINGRGQQSNNDPQRSLFFEGQKPNRIVLDLGSIHAVTKFNSYSWHQYRYNQYHDLYFATDSVAPPSSSAVKSGDLVVSGWFRLAHVNSALPLVNDTQVVVSIRPRWGTILVEAQYILIDILDQTTFYGEIDVYVSDL